MKSKFKLFHGLLLMFYIVMYSTSVFQLSSKWRLPLTHKQFGLGFALMLTIFLLFNGKTILKRLRYFFDLSKGKFMMKLFKLSVVLMILHFVMSIVSGVLMNFGLNTYVIHALSKYIVPILVIFHLFTHLFKKY
ncbi:MAG: hypothetical protein JEZ08_09535 [Clostridiales bacterium]|nr:hypothetical protein [Clostridiales bacterium]